MNLRLGNSTDLQNTTASSVPTPASGTLTIFSEGNKLKQKDSTGAVSDLTQTGGITDGDYGDIIVSSTGSSITVKEPALRKSETSVNNSPLFFTINKFDTLQTNFY